jgi:hypothetical protein
MKAYGGVDVQIHIFLPSALIGGKRSASRPNRFTPDAVSKTFLRVRYHQTVK